jgi:hypothetical protein
MAKLEQTLGTDLASIAQLLRSKGRGKDSVLAHITPKEAALLKRRGGRGSVNPDTGLPEYEDTVDAPIDQAPVDQAPVDQAPVDQAPVDQAPVNVFDNSQPAPTYAFTPSEAISGSQRDMSTPFQNFNPADNAAARSILGMGNVEPGAAPTVDTGDKTPVKPEQGGKDPFKMPSLGQLGTLGLAGALGAYGASQARRGAAQTQAGTAEQKAIAAPYQQQGQQLISQAQAGQLTPTSQQALEAAKAQLAQSQSNRGGVGAQQSANQIANIYQTLLDNQYKYGLQVMQIGDNISLGAIKSGLQLDQQLQTSTNNFYSQLASIVGGQPIRVGF